MAWDVAFATPPSVPADGEGRMYAAGSALSLAIRVLSPRTEPPVRTDEGSTASTPTRCPPPVRVVPSDSMNVDLPTPGTPETPTRRAGVAPANEAASSLTSSRAAERWSGLDDSTSVIARETEARRP